MHPPAGPCAGGRRAGSASRSVLLLALLAAAILVALALYLWTTGPTGAEPATAEPHAEPPTPAQTAPGIDREAAAPLERDGRAVRSEGELVSVRLSGDGRLQGRVLDRASGTGVPGVQVELSPLPPVAASLADRILRLIGMGPDLPERVRPVATAVSGTSGDFAFAGVRSGAWFVEARGPYHAPENAVRARVLASGGGGPIEVHVRAGGRVLGRVLAPDGSPARSARVVLLGGPGRFIEDAASGDLRLYEAACDEDGAFSFDGVPPGGAYDLSAAGSGFAVSHVLDVQVVAGEDREVDIRAREGGSISGRVLGTRGEEPPEPIAGAHVAAVPRGLRDLLLVGEVLAATHSVTASDGSFVMRNVPPGEVDLAAVAVAHLPAIGGRASVVDGRSGTASDILLSAGTMLRGRTVDSAGNAIADVLVRWNPLGGSEEPGQDLSFAPMLARALPGFVFPRTDADGRFAAGPMAGSPPHSLEFHKVGFKVAHETVDDEKAKAEFTVVLSRGGTVEGTVVDAATSDPITTFTVSTKDAIDTETGTPGSWNPFTGGRLFEDDLGRFRLDAVAAGKTTLWVGSRGYADAPVEVEVVEGDATRDVKVELRKGGTVRGVVLGEKSRPIAGAHVIAVPEDSEERGGDRRSAARELDAASIPPFLLGYAAGLGLLGDKGTVSGSRGEFELVGVEGGALRVKAFHRDHAWGKSDVLSLPEGGSLEGVQVDLHPGGGVEGTVSDRHGRPIAGDVVVAFAPTAMGGMGGFGGGGSRPLYQGFSDAKGAYRISHMAAGSYFLVVTRGDEALHPMSFIGRLNFDMVTVPEGVTVRYDLVDSFSGGCRVFGTVSDAGVPVSEGMVMAMGYEGGGALGVDMKLARLSSSGRFEFPGLAPGRWQLNLSGSSADDVRMIIDVPDQAEYRVDLTLPEGGLEGSAVDDATGQPVPNAIVNARPLGAPKLKGLLAMVIREESGSRTTTDEAGQFAFERLCAAEYEVTVRPPNRKEDRKRWAPSEPVIVEVREGRIERGCVLRLYPPLTLVGSVKGEQGEPVAGAKVLVRPQGREGARADRATCDEKGAFEVGGLGPGLYTISASQSGHAPTVMRDVKVERSGRAPVALEIRLQRGVAVTVRVFGSDGRPISGARATLVRAESESELDPSEAERVLEGIFKGEGASDVEGRIEMGRFNPGEYRLEVQRGGASQSLPRVRIPGDRGEHELRAELP